MIRQVSQVLRRAPLETLSEHHKVRRKRSIAMSSVKQVQELTTDELEPQELSELTADELDPVGGGFQPEICRWSQGDHSVVSTGNAKIGA